MTGQTFTFDSPLAVDTIGTGMAIAFGEAAQDLVKPMVVRKIRYQGNFSFQVVITDAAEAIMDDENSTAPAYSDLSDWVPQTAPAPVQNLVAQAIPNQRGFSTDVDVLLSWQRGIGPIRAAVFRVFENDVLVAELASDAALQVTLQARAAAQTFLYRVVGLSETGNVIERARQASVSLFTPNYAFSAIETLASLPDPDTWSGALLVYSIEDEKYFSLETKPDGSKVWQPQGGGGAGSYKVGAVTRELGKSSFADNGDMTYLKRV